MSLVASRLRRSALAAVLALGCSVWLNAQEDAADEAPSSNVGIIKLIALRGAIGPATADFLAS